MGSFIYKNVVHKGRVNVTKSRYYGMYESMYQYYNANSYKNLSKNTYPNNQVSINHLTPTELLKLQILSPTQAQSLTFFTIMREPFERFVSLCNYWQVVPNKMVNTIKRREQMKFKNYVAFQHTRPQSDFIRNIQQMPKYRIFTMNHLGELQQFLRENIPSIDSLDFTEKVCKSEDVYTIRSISNEDMAFLREYYRDDIILYDELSRDTLPSKEQV
jgi:hypothetical protein